LFYRELRHLLTRELGIVMRGEEMRRLVDAFDTNEVRRYPNEVHGTPGSGGHSLPLPTYTNDAAN